MSCWIVKDESLNKLVKYFIKCSYSGYCPECQIKSVWEKLGYNLNWDYETDLNPNAERLLNDLSILNNKSFNNNYEIEEEEHKTLIYDYGVKEEKNIYQLLKSIECLHYQSLDISETEDQKYKDLLKALKKICVILSSYIINNLEEYKKAEWE